MTGATCAGVVVVGAGVAGTALAGELRRAGYDAPVTLVDAERHLPYDRPPLSKQFLLGDWDQARVTVLDPQTAAGPRVALRLGVPVVAHDATGVELADGSRIAAEHVVLASGLRARRLPGQPNHPAILTLRTLDDAVRLSARLDAGSHILVIGGGFIGGEVASAARARGARVTVLEVTGTPLEGVLGVEVGALFAGLYAANGVEFRGGVGVHSVRADVAAPVVRLTDGTILTADTVVVGIGAEPANEWAAHGGIVECDPVGRVCDCDGKPVPGLYAIGDVAAWRDPVTGAPERVEHWTSARDQAADVARLIASGVPSSEPRRPAYFWTDQFGLKIQVVGRPHLGERSVVVRAGDGGALAGTVVAHFAGERAVGCVLFSSMRRLRVATSLVADGADEAALRAALA